MLTLSVLALALAAPAKLEFSHPIDRAEVVLEALGKEVGVSIRPSGVLGDDRIYVRLRDTDWETAKQKLAEGLRAEWRESGGTLYLHRPKAEETDEREAAIESLKRWQKSIKVDSDYSFQTLVRKLSEKESDKQEGSSSGYGGRNGFDMWVSLYDEKEPLKDVGLLAPGARTLLRLIPLLDPEEVGRQMDFPRTIASTDPMPRDMKLPATAASLLKQYWADRTVAIRASEAATRSEYDFWYFDDLYMSQIPPPDDQVPMVIIDVDEDSLQLELVCLVDSRLMQMGNVSIQFDTRSAIEDDEEPTDFSKITDPLVLTRDQWAVSKLLEGRYRWDDDDSFSEQDKARAMELMKDPVVNEPLRLTCEPILEQAAKAMGVSMVALMSDLSFSHMHWVGEDDLTVGDALTWLVSHTWPTRISEADGYFLLSSRDLPGRETWNLDRVGARDFSAEIERTNEISLEALLKLYRRVGDSSLFSTVVSHVGTANGIDTMYMQEEVFELLSGLLPVQIQAARSTGYKVMARNMAVAAQTHVLDQICQMHETVSKSPLSESEVNSRFGGAYDFGITDVGPSVRETARPVQALLALRNGIPPGVVADIRIYRNLTITPKPKEDERGPRPMGMGYGTGIEAFAMTVFWESRRAEEGQREPRLDMKNLSLGYSETLLIVLEMPGVGYTYIQESLPTGVADPQYGPYEDLPREVRDEIAATIKRIEERYGGG